MKKNIVLIVVSLSFLTSFPQDILKMENFTSMRNLSDAIFFDNGFWCASNGGVFFYDLENNDFIKLQKSNGLGGANILTLDSDKQGKIWFGSNDGFIDVYNPNTKSIKKITDIINSNITIKRINNISIFGDTAFVSTSFGLSLININNYSFYDTYFKFGNLPTNLEVNYSFKDDLIYLATPNGLAVQKPGTVNLTDPESWNIYTTSNGLPSNNVIQIGKYKNEVIVLTSNGLAKKSDSTWQLLIPSLTSQDKISSFFIKQDSLFLNLNNYLFVWTNNNLIQLSNTYLDNSPKIIDVNENGFYLTSNNGLMNIARNGEVNYFFPNGPKANIVSDMNIDINGNLWVASGTDVTGVGFYKYNGIDWQNYDLNTNPEFLSNSFFRVYSAPDGKVYLGNWGKGFVELLNDNAIKVFNAFNTDLVGISKDINFLVIPGLGLDSKNNLWILNYGAANRKNISVLTPDSVWYHFENPANFNSDVHSRLLIDQYDTKWFVATGTGKGLYFLNDNGTLINTNDDNYGYLGSTNGLNSNDIYSLALDQRGELWVGTSSGMNVITNPNIAVNGSANQFRISSVFTLRQQTINCVAIDAINRKWVGTNQGVLVVSPDGTQLIHTFDIKNSPILSDEIKSITIDQKNGIVYVGVDGGITAFYTAAKSPQENFTSLNLYPSPFIIGDSKNNLTIDGLIRDSEIKILNITGKLIRHFETLGGKISFWDGRDSEGNFVNTGIYLIVAYDKDGNNIHTEKIAVIRK